MSRVRVFAYGSNLCIARLKSRSPSAEVLSPARLHSHRLHFHKRGRDGSGKADAVHTGNHVDTLWGVVYSLEVHDKRRLDEIEGLGTHYLEREVEVLTPAEDLLTAFMYHAHPEMIDASQRPYIWYKRLVVEGGRAHGLPDDYIEHVAGVEHIDDPCSKRAVRESRVLVTGPGRRRR